MKMVKCLPEFKFFTVFLKNRNFISKIKRSKVTDYAALRDIFDPLKIHDLGMIYLHQYKC